MVKLTTKMVSIKELSKGLERALKAQAKSVLIVNAGDLNLEKLAAKPKGNISIYMNGNPYKNKQTYRNLLQLSNTKKYDANLFVIESEKNEEATGTFYKTSKNIFDSANFIKRESLYMSEKGSFRNKDKVYMTLNR